MTKRSCSYRELLMQAALQASPVVERPPADQAARQLEARCLSVFLGFEALRYRLHLRRVSK
ncbi:MAG TPA: hypothetical protein VNZ06_05080 [Steroidobacteraceae bacterium]|jgi:hypothetical protein|nr:hypothetical protein [Steroidobacteraceae bacterium]